MGATQRFSCSSNVCHVKARLASRVPPCSDFYAYVCAEWDEGNLQSPHEAHLAGVLQRLQRTLAQEPVPSRQQSSFQKAAAFYQSCLAVLMDGKSELREVSQALKSAGVRWPRRSKNPDLLLAASRLRLIFDLDAPLVFKMPDAATLSVEPPSRGWLLDAKRIRYALDFSGKYLEYFRVLWRAFDDGDTVEADAVKLRATEDAMFLRFRTAESSWTAAPKRQTYALSALPYICAPFSGYRWYALLKEIFYCDQEMVTAVEIKDNNTFSVVCRMVNDLHEAAVHYYVEWLAVQTLAANSDRSISQFILNGADIVTLAVPSVCFRKTMRLFGEPVLINGTRRWREESPTSLSDVRRVAKDVREALSEVVRNISELAQADMLLKDLLSEEPYAEYRERIVESVYSAVPDMSQGYLRNQRSLLNVSLNRDAIDSLGFSWEALEDTLHNGASVRPQLSAERLFLKLSYAAYFLHNADMSHEYNYASFGVVVARQLLALHRHAMRPVAPGFSPTNRGQSTGSLVASRSDFSIAVDVALTAAFKAHGHKAGPRKSRDFFLVTCFQVCSGRNTQKQRRNFVLDFAASKAFHTAFSCLSKSHK
ncbi:hypothetical protein V5799_024794 [Amblyomma americanum]|uniref:Peptidase M13 N-terminal domain-containing protein n=1 Tax=Amblyomma americanum TaxID=6943 RepID=A0AAQ4EBJ3_AMBAM